MTNELLRQLAMEARNMDSQEEKKATPRKTNAPQFEVTLAEYPDLIVTRTTATTKRTLVILFTAGAAFIKNNDGTNVPLNADNYAEFTSRMPDLPLPEGYWTAALKKGKEAGAKIVGGLGVDPVRNAIKQGVFHYFGDLLGHIDHSCLNAVQECIPSLFQEFCASEKCRKLMMNAPVFIRDIWFRFGLDNARDFLGELDVSLAKLHENRYGNGPDYTRRLFYGMRRFEDANIAFKDDDTSLYAQETSTIPAVKMKYSSFKNYVLYDAVAFGYGDIMENFFNEWLDTLDMQYKVYGKIKEKYPDNLPLMHHQLAYKARLMKEEIDERNFLVEAEKAKRFEGTCGDYVFISPKTKQDFFDEATAQSNCLASYVSRFAEGKSIILFMRKKDTPDTPYITIEVTPDGRVSQAKLARNVNPSVEIRDIINKWVAAHNSAAAVA